MILTKCRLLSKNPLADKVKVANGPIYKPGFFKGVLGTRFGFSESEKIVIGFLESEIGSLQVHTGYLTFSLKKLQTQRSLLAIRDNRNTSESDLSSTDSVRCL